MLILEIIFLIILLLHQAHYQINLLVAIVLYQIMNSQILNLLILKYLVVIQILVLLNEVKQPLLM